MATDSVVVAIPRRTVLYPIAWVLRSGWINTQAEVLDLDDDGAAAHAVSAGEATVALLDPLQWARQRVRFRPVPRVAVALGPTGTDMQLLSAVRLDGLERITSPQLPRRTSEEAVPRTLVREYYGLSESLQFHESGRVEGPEGRIVTGMDALRNQQCEFVESLSKAWWIMSGTPWVRALAVEAADTPPNPGSEKLLKEVDRLLGEQEETVAAELAREHGGQEDRWLELVRALGLSYGAEERKALASLLTHAARLRLAPRVDDAALPRY